MCWDQPCDTTLKTTLVIILRGIRLTPMESYLLYLLSQVLTSSAQMSTCSTSTFELRVSESAKHVKLSQTLRIALHWSAWEAWKQPWMQCLLLLLSLLVLQLPR